MFYVFSPNDHPEYFHDESMSCSISNFELVISESTGRMPFKLSNSIYKITINTSVIRFNKTENLKYVHNPFSCKICLQQK